MVMVLSITRQILMEIDVVTPDYLYLATASPIANP